MPFKAKFHYASWFADSELVRSWFGAGSELKFGLSSIAGSELARASRFAAKFHYASRFGAGSKLVRSWFEAGSNQLGFWNLASNLLRTSSEPASVMEFGFYSD